MASEPGFMFSRSIENPDGYVWEIVWTRSRSGVKLKRPPIERLAVYRRRMNQRQLRRAQRLIGSPARLELAIEPVHEQRRRGIVGLPQCGDHAVRSRAQKGPGQSHQPFADIGAKPRTIAGGNGDQPRLQWTMHDVARIELEVLRVLRRRRQDHRRIERTRSARRAVRDEVNVSILIRSAHRIRRRHRSRLSEQSGAWSRSLRSDSRSAPVRSLPWAGPAGSISRARAATQYGIGAAIRGRR